MFLDTITKWMVVLKKQIGAVLDEDKGTGIDIATQQAQVQWFQNYVEPAKEDGSGKPSFTDSSALAEAMISCCPRGWNPDREPRCAHHHCMQQPT